MNGKSSSNSFDSREEKWSRARKPRHDEKLDPFGFLRGQKDDDLDIGIVTQQRVKVAESNLRGLEQRVRASEAKYEQLRQEVSDTKKQAQKQEDALKQSTSALVKMDSQVKNDKLQAIQILALFVAFFTFVSVEFQLFNNVKSPGALVALSMMLLGALTIFVGVTYLGLAYYAEKTQPGTAPSEEAPDEPALRFNKNFLWGITQIAFIFLAFGVGLNVWITHNDMRAAREKNESCVRLAADIVKELERSDSRVTDFMKLRYESECRTTPKASTE